MRALALILFLSTPLAAQDLIQREERSRESVPGSETMEVVVTHLKILPGGTIPRHTHPGDEYLAVLVGGDMQAPDGRVIPFAAGTTVRFPDSAPHGGLTNVGDGPLEAITTHVVRKGEPLTTLVD